MVGHRPRIGGGPCSSACAVTWATCGARRARGGAVEPHFWFSAVGLTKPRAGLDALFPGFYVYTGELRMECYTRFMEYIIAVLIMVVTVSI